MPIEQRVSRFFSRRIDLLYLIIFVAAVGLFTYLQLDPTFADPDSFYHAKAAMLLRDRGAITEFPWLSATTLKYHFIDHHFIYHLILIPFVSYLPSLIGLKVATILLASLTIVTIFWFLRRLGVKGAFWYAFFLLTVAPFIFRINLAKAQALVLILLFISLYFLLRRYYLAFSVLVFCYVWLYAGWPLVAVFTLLYLLISWTYSVRSRQWIGPQPVKQARGWQRLQLLLALGIGIGLGIFLSPYFPKNLSFYWQQSFQIAVVNYQSLIGVGGEWYPYPLVDLLTAAAPLFVLFTAAGAVFLITRRKQPVDSWLFFIFSLIFFALTLKSRRNVEYFVPLAVIFSALTFRSASEAIKRWFRAGRRPAIISLVVFALALAFVSGRYIQEVKGSMRNGFSFNKFAEPSQWLSTHTPAGSIVFHSDWDEFPLLFYHNDHNYYIVGLDPTFMYQYDPNLYRRWVDITTGRSSERLAQTIGTLFGARYVFVDIQTNQAFDRNLAQSGDFKEVFANGEARIYEIR